MTGYRGVIWDVGGVLTQSPLDALRKMEEDLGAPRGLAGQAAKNGAAWSRLERGELSREEFGELFLEETRALGFGIDGKAALDVLSGLPVRRGMASAVMRCRDLGYRQAVASNTFTSGGNKVGVGGRVGREEELMGRIYGCMDYVFESAREGLRKPEAGVYERVLEELGLEASAAVFLDDLGVNLKAARALGLRTIKVEGEESGLRELGEVLGEDFSDFPALLRRRRRLRVGRFV